MQDKAIKGEDAPWEGDLRENVLVAAANTLINVVPQIRHLVSCPDPAGLRQWLIEEIQRVEVRAQKAGLSYEVIVGARYCLCTVLDEAAALTPWGGEHVWPGNGLLVTFHNETWGGEKFFQLLARLSQNPRDHLFMLELIYFCLMLGFEGRYRVLDNGRAQLDTIRQRLHQMIRSVRGSYPQALSQHAEDRPEQTRLWRPVIPLWAVAAVAGCLACLLYITLNWRLGDAATPVLASIYQTQVPEAAIANPAPQAPPALDLKGFLSREIQQGLVSVRDEADRSVVTLQGDELFASASTSLREKYEPVIARIASAMNQVSGNILVIGHSDNRPIRSARFASNYELSLARAMSVVKQLERRLNQPQRLSAEGQGDAWPVAPNDSAENRARNRRVEIVLLVAPDVTLRSLQQGN
ncbi:DotU family type VI secretion system protein [Kalamiella sp. sgz302252]|uniref:DotU family type VI secretion system protein n=1 Tax=Pantoea sp. sgz302252 TaxID=3341827 RepID=UPI0036D38FB8